MEKSRQNEISSHFLLWGPNDIGSVHLNCILHDLFKDNPLDHICRAQICQYCNWRAYFDESNLVEWGNFDKTMQNAVQDPQVNSYDQNSLWRDFPIVTRPTRNQETET